MQCFFFFFIMHRDKAILAYGEHHHLWPQAVYVCVGLFASIVDILRADWETNRQCSSLQTGSCRTILLQSFE